MFIVLLKVPFHGKRRIYEERFVVVSIVDEIIANLHLTTDT